MGLATRSGAIVHWIYTGPLTDSVNLSWDGRDAAHRPFQTGSYSLRIITRASGGIGTSLPRPTAVMTPADVTITASGIAVASGEA